MRKAHPVGYCWRVLLHLLGCSGYCYDELGAKDFEVVIREPLLSTGFAVGSGDPGSEVGRVGVVVLATWTSASPAACDVGLLLQEGFVDLGEAESGPLAFEAELPPGGEFAFEASTWAWIEADAGVALEATFVSFGCADVLSRLEYNSWYTAEAECRAVGDSPEWFVEQQW